LAKAGVEDCGPGQLLSQCQNCDLETIKFGLKDDDEAKSIAMW